MSPTHRNGRDLESARDGWGLGAAARALEWRVNGKRFEVASQRKRFGVASQRQ